MAHSAWHRASHPNLCSGNQTFPEKHATCYHKTRTMTHLANLCQPVVPSSATAPNCLYDCRRLLRTHLYKELRTDGLYAAPPDGTTWQTQHQSYLLPHVWCSMPSQSHGFLDAAPRCHLSLSVTGCTPQILTTGVVPVPASVCMAAVGLDRLISHSPTSTARTPHDANRCTSTLDVIPLRATITTFKSRSEEIRVRVNTQHRWV